MKNLMTPALTILTIAAMSQVGIAQDKMAKPMGKDKTYTGCIAAGDVAGSYTLTHVTAEMAMGHGEMKKDPMVGHGEMKKDPAGKNQMGKDATAHSMAITSTSVDLAKHVGHKVSVTGPDNGMGMAMGKGDTVAKETMGKGKADWSVTSLKMVAATCPN